MEDKQRDFFDDVIMGPDGPLYWILIFLLFMVFGLGPVIGISITLGTRQKEAQCKEWVGNNYVFDDPWCYRMVDGKLNYVDIDRERAINEYDRR